MPQDTPTNEDEPVFLRIGAAARLLGVSISTLRRLEKNGRLAEYGVKVYYTPTQRRRYKKREILEALERSAKG
ncbi:MAG: MerR family DNA-binding transcriptional regulator [Gemmatimonadota bacterium]|nr:MerR family DNA-binding transcriptional regulator [Gemmatimonadota bacterium]